MSRQQSWTLSDYLQGLRRRRWWSLAAVLAVIFIGVIYLTTAPRQYCSNAKLFIRVGRENAVLDPTVGTNEEIPVTVSREIEMNSIVEHLRSRGILELVVRRLDPEYENATPEGQNATLDRYARMIFVTSPHMSTIVNVEATTTSPKKSQELVATLVDIYMDDHMRINRANGSYEFFVEQTKLLRDELDAAQSMLRDAKNRAGMASIEGRRVGLENQISSLESQVQQVSAAIVASEARSRELKKLAASLPTSLLDRLVEGTANDGVASMQDRLFELRIREQEILANYKPTHPSAVAVREQVQEIASALKQNEPDRQEVLSTITAREEANGASLSKEKAELEDQLIQRNDALQSLNEDAIVVEELTLKTRQLETRYLKYVESLEETRMDQALRNDRISNVSIIQPATFEPSPVRPRKMLGLLVMLMAAGVCGCLVAMTGLRSDNSRMAE